MIKLYFTDFIVFQVRAPATHSSSRSARTSPNSVSSPNFSLTLSPSLSASLSPHITQAILDDLDFDVQFEQTFLAQQKAVSMCQCHNLLITLQCSVDVRLILSILLCRIPRISKCANS